jgi:[protein-PII] uridylyltransferase
MLPADRVSAEAGYSLVESEQAFRLSMPESYLADFGDAAVAEHARIVARRQGAFVHVEPCGVDQTTDPPTYRICVVTDDRPGLLSLLSVAISAHGLDVKNARIYCRARPSKPREVIDFFAVQPVKGAPLERFDADDVSAIRDSIAGLLGKDTDVEWLARRSSPTSRIRAVVPAAIPAGPAPIAQAAFLAERDRDVLAVETEDRPNLLLAITLALYRRRLNIVRSNIATLETRARDDFELSEFDGSRLSEPRKREALGAVVAAIGRIANEQVL